MKGRMNDSMFRGYYHLRHRCDGYHRRCGHRLRRWQQRGEGAAAKQEPALLGGLQRERCQLGPNDAMAIGPCIPAGTQLQQAEVGPASGPTYRLAHLQLLHRCHALPPHILLLPRTAFTSASAALQTQAGLESARL